MLMRINAERKTYRAFSGRSARALDPIDRPTKTHGGVLSSVSTALADRGFPKEGNEETTTTSEIASSIMRLMMDDRQKFVHTHS